MSVYDWSYGFVILVGPLLGAALLALGPVVALVFAGATACAASLVFIRHAIRERGVANHG